MDNYTENRFGYLRELSKDEMLNMIEDTKNEIEYLENLCKDKKASGEQVSEAYNDIKFDREKLEYLNSILNEKHI